MYTNHLEKLLELYPEKFKDCSIRDLLFNPNLTWNSFKKGFGIWHELDLKDSVFGDIPFRVIDSLTREEKLCWYKVSRNPFITDAKVENNLELPWNWHFLSSNPSITFNLVKKFPDKDWCWYSLSKHPNITWEIIQNNPEYPWTKSGISANPNMTVEIIEENNLDIYGQINNLKMSSKMFVKYHREFIDAVGIRHFQGLDNIIEIMNELPDLPWNRSVYKGRCKVEKMLSYDDIPRLFEEDLIPARERRIWLSYAPLDHVYSILTDPDYKYPKWKNGLLENHHGPRVMSIYSTLEEILNKPEYQWDWDLMARYNLNLTLDFVLENPDKPWNWNILCTKPTFIRDIIRRNPGKKWDLKGEILYDRISREEFLESPEKFWGWYNFSINPYMTWEFIRDNIDGKWLWDSLARNRFELSGKSRSDIEKITLREIFGTISSRFNYFEKGILKLIEAFL